MFVLACFVIVCLEPIKHSFHGQSTGCYVLEQTSMLRQGIYEVCCTSVQSSTIRYKWLKLILTEIFHLFFSCWTLVGLVISCSPCSYISYTLYFCNVFTHGKGQASFCFFSHILPKCLMSFVLAGTTAT